MTYKDDEYDIPIKPDDEISETFETTALAVEGEHAMIGGKRIGRLDRDTTVATTLEVATGANWQRVGVTSGSQTGKVGWVKASFLSDTKAEPKGKK